MINDMLGPYKPGPPKTPTPKIQLPDQPAPPNESVEAPYIEPARPLTNSSEPIDDISDEINEPAEKPKLIPAKTKRKRHLWPVGWSTKKKRIFTGLLVVLLLLLIGGGAYAYQKSHETKVTPAVKKATVPPKPTTEASRLTGVQISPELNKRAVTGVMIENSPDARPQSGLLDAGVVYEAVAEGGITRFLALFQETQPAYVGPIRSARPYYLDWLLPYDAGYAHVGGSPEALSQIKSLKVKDLDQFANGSTYDRVTSRYAPHNVYTSIARLYDLAQKKGYGASTFTGFARKPKAEPVATPTAKTIDLNISSALFNVHYDYDTASNSYKRSEGGKPHTDEKTATQLAPKVVVALVIPSAIESDGSHSSYATTGSGSMFVFQDGVVIPGTWKKASRSGQFIFTNAAGQPLNLSPGQTWVSMVGTVGSVAYKP